MAFLPTHLQDIVEKGMFTIVQDSCLSHRQCFSPRNNRAETPLRRSLQRTRSANSLSRRSRLSKSRSDSSLPTSRPGMSRWDNETPENKKVGSNAATSNRLRSRPLLSASNNKVADDAAPKPPERRNSLRNLFAAERRSSLRNLFQSAAASSSSSSTPASTAATTSTDELRGSFRNLLAAQKNGNNGGSFRNLFSSQQAPPRAPTRQTSARSLVAGTQ